MCWLLCLRQGPAFFFFICLRVVEADFTLRFVYIQNAQNETGNSKWAPKWEPPPPQSTLSARQNCPCTPGSRGAVGGQYVDLEARVQTDDSPSGLSVRLPKPPHWGLEHQAHTGQARPCCMTQRAPPPPACAQHAPVRRYLRPASAPQGSGAVGSPGRLVTVTAETTEPSCVAQRRPHRLWAWVSGGGVGPTPPSRISSAPPRGLGSGTEPKTPPPP